VGDKDIQINILTSELEQKHKQLIEIETSLTNTKAQHIDFMTNVHKANQFEIEKLKGDNERLVNEIESARKEQHDLSTNKSKEIEENMNKLSIAKEDIDKFKKIIDELSGNINNLTIENVNLKKKKDDLQQALLEKDKKITDFTELTKLCMTTDNNFLSSTKGISNNFIPEIQLNTLAITSNILRYDDEYVSVKKLDKGTKVIFVPHSPGTYVCINLNNAANYTTNNVANYTTNVDSNNYDSNMDNKFFKCNAILSMEYFDSELKELLIENSLIIIGRIGKVTDHYATGESNPYNIPEETNYLLCELDKIDYILGFQGEEMIFRNYIF